MARTDSCKIHFCCISSVIFVKCRHCNIYTLKKVYKGIRKDLSNMRFHVLTAPSTKTTVFWDAAPFSLTQVYRRFRDACCLHFLTDVGSKHIWKVGPLLQDNAAQHPRRQSIMFRPKYFRATDTNQCTARYKTMQTTIGYIHELTNLRCACRLPSCFAPLLILSLFEKPLQLYIG
jgi:hypothetical protein